MFCRTQQAILIAAPMTMVTAFFLLVPHDDGDYPGTLAQMAGESTRNSAGWFLAFVACALLISCGAILANTIAGSFPRLAGTATLLLTLGWVGTASIAPTLLLATDVAEHAPRQSVAAGLTAFNDGLAGLFFLMSVLGVAGAITLAVGLFRTGTVPKAAAILTALGTILTIIMMAGPIRPLLVAAAAILLAGNTWSALSAVAPSARTPVPDLH